MQPFFRVVLPRVLLVLAVLVLAGCESLKGMQIQGVNVGALASAGDKLMKSGKMSEQEEVAMGSHMAGMLLGAAPLDRNAATQRYVNKVGRWLTLHSARPDLPWRFGVLADNDYNAFAAPGGYVFITRGLFNSLQSEAELAGVLAHEIAHVTNRHYVEAVQSNNLVGAAADFGVFLASAATNSAEQDEMAERVVGASREVYARGLDKGDEYQSDRDAITLMVKAGYDPYAFYAVMQRLDARSANDSKMALLLQTHPSPAARLEEMIPQLEDIDTTHLVTLETRFRKKGSE